MYGQHHDDAGQPWVKAEKASSAAFTLGCMAPNDVKYVVLTFGDALHCDEIQMPITP